MHGDGLQGVFSLWIQIVNFTERFLKTPYYVSRMSFLLLRIEAQPYAAINGGTILISHLKL